MSICFYSGIKEAENKIFFRITKAAVGSRQNRWPKGRSWPAGAARAPKISVRHGCGNPGIWGLTTVYPIPVSRVH